MAKSNRVVHGSYNNHKEAVEAIRSLREQGYTKDQITVYSNDRDDRSFDKIDEDEAELRNERTFDKTDRDAYDKNEEGSFDTVDKNSEERSEQGSYDVVDKNRASASANMGDMTETTDEDDDESLWEQVKDFFTADTYDYETESENPNYRRENDILYPHREDLMRGNRVVVLDKPNEEINRVNI